MYSNLLDKWKDLLGFIYNKEFKVGGTFQETVKKTISEETVNGTNKVMSLLQLCAKAVANNIAKEKFTTQKEVLDSISSLEIQRQVLLELFIDVFPKTNNTLCTFVLEQKDYFRAWQLYYSGENYEETPSPGALLGGYLGPHYLVDPPTLKIDWKSVFKEAICM